MRPPIAVTLRLDQRELPAQVFERYAAREDTRRLRAERAEKAWESFGKPGREPSRLGGVANLIARDGDWIPHLKISELNNHWDRVVGPAVAQHSHVIAFKDGVLTIGTESPVWATQLTYLLPQLNETIRRNLEGLDIADIRVVGPTAGYTRRWARRK
ncbi:DUF721 domain-containing protein [Bifidobacterium sp. MA2]|uniref:DUF721 domain-containing protein n=1 Tax=Bifidobacterium santillanense TaxID=2809028 RepID=A0ABS5UNX8_9BIFI|nr:DUF721 domain-containing protein [Bifidobacterium santillanense]MBT1172617.1 DUF721 domain-containing protein [Bifidobacterium santillanense]